jgi:large subunit ribosomal protein L9
MEVILKEDVAKLGNRGDVVKVEEGYGRNFLLPRKLAVEATQANKAVIEQMKAAAVRRTQRDKADAESLASQLAPVAITLQRRSGEHDQLFGSVTSSDIAAELEHKGFNIDRRKIHLDEPIKTLGEFTVPIRLYRDVTAHVKVTVEKEAVEE